MVKNIWEAQSILYIYVYVYIYIYVFIDYPIYIYIYVVCCEYYIYIHIQYIWDYHSPWAGNIYPTCQVWLRIKWFWWKMTHRHRRAVASLFAWESQGPADVVSIMFRVKNEWFKKACVLILTNIRHAHGMYVYIYIQIHRYGWLSWLDLAVDSQPFWSVLRPLTKIALI